MSDAIPQHNLDTGESKKLVIPRGRKGLPPITVDMTKIYRTEARIQEIRVANPMTLPDLITEFNMGIIELGNKIGIVSLEKREAEQELKEATSIALLDKVEPYLAAKKIKSSADMREAAVILDPDVKNARNKVDFLTAVLEILENKHKAIEMAYYSAKKVCDIQLRHPDGTNYGGSTDVTPAKRSKDDVD